MLKDETGKKYQFRKFTEVKKNSNQKNEDQIWLEKKIKGE